MGSKKGLESGIPPDFPTKDPSLVLGFQGRICCREKLLGQPIHAYEMQEDIEVGLADGGPSIFKGQLLELEVPLVVDPVPPPCLC